VNGTIKVVAPLVAALAIAACNAGGSSSMPGTTGATGQAPAASHGMIPDWQAQHLATPVCADARPGRANCLALLQSREGLRPNVAGIAPIDIQTRYALPITKGSGQIVAIVDAYDNPNIASDLGKYRTNFGLGTATFNKYNQLGQQSNYPQGSTGWGVEEDLDVDMVSAACPKCTIYLIEANSNQTSDLEIAEAEAVTLGAHIISNSWICYGSSCGTSESSFNTPGVVYLAASGDSGYNQNGPPEWFGSVVSVGGTVLSKTGSTYKEVVWNGAGGGCSSNGGGSGQTKPSWQKDPKCTKRTDADVSANAWDAAEYDSYGAGGWITVGGTSAASPLNAGVFGLAGNASSQTDAKKFWTLSAKKLKHALNYISVGNNGSCGGSYLCTAGTHQFKTYSGPAGWGTPHGIGAY
jgi:subtilase family serine protease